jgi:hypothetical protein
VRYLIQGFRISSLPSSVGPAASLCRALKGKKRTENADDDNNFKFRLGAEELLLVNRGKLITRDKYFVQLTAQIYTCRLHGHSQRPKLLPHFIILLV